MLLMVGVCVRVSADALPLLQFCCVFKLSELFAVWIRKVAD